MKKVLLSIILGLTAGSTALAQLNAGGIPLSFRSEPAVAAQKIPSETYPTPDWNNRMEKASDLPGPYVVALFSPSDISFPASGILTETADGHRIWRTQIRINEAKAIGLYYDKFHLPPGVKLYVYNNNAKHILGAYTSSNNSASGKFAIEAVQGEITNIELDIDPEVRLSDIQLHINRSAVYFRGVDYLSPYAYADDLHEIDAIDSALSGVSSVCMVDAVCPLGSGYEVQRDATLQQLLPVNINGQQGVASCSGTMINTTDNTEQNCKQYYLTATHCEPSNSIASSDLDQLILRFNFMKSACDSSITIPESNTMVGANFIARADYTAIAATDINGDFLLLELRDAIPESWGINLAGWNNNGAIPTTVSAPEKFIGFHHPGGDMKKVSASSSIQSFDLGGASSHWATQLGTDQGLVATGSSGSALFDGGGRVIGIASVAGPNNLPDACFFNAEGDSATGTANLVLYSKFSHDWDYSADGNDDMRKLKPWLDPASTGVITVDAVKSNCTELDGGGGSGITIADNLLDEAINIYPNPVTGNQVNVQVNLTEKSDMIISAYDITGKMIKRWKLNAVRSGTYALGMSGFARGMYLLKFQNGHAQTSKKVMLQ